ncbi:MAG: FAD-dependent oxidoreductase [Melioribacteraceae bacterium]
MKRDIDKLKNTEFDLLIIGGGIHGATLAYEASIKGLKVCLIEKDDFGSQTSANSLKVLHGGLRYLQHANFKRMRESIHSRKVFQQIAPHLVKNIPFVIPTSGFTIKSKFALRIAMFLNDLISWDRNKKINKDCFVPGGKTISPIEFSNISSIKNDDKITGGALWYESVALNTERLLFEFLHRSYEYKAVLFNYLEAIKYNFDGNKITSVSVKDSLNNENFQIKAKFVVNTVGPWLNEILKGTQDFKLLKTPLTKAVNIIVKGNLFGKYAIGLESIKEFKDKSAIINKGKRLFFFVPLENHTMIGTTYKVYKEHPDECNVTKEDINEILTEINQANKNLNLKFEDVTQTHVGVQAMPDVEFKNEFDVQPETHSLVFNHNEKGKINNLISVKSVKYTTAPSIAKQVIENLPYDLNISPLFIKSEKEEIKIYNKIKSDFFQKFKTYDSKFLNRIWKTYGTRSEKVIARTEFNEESRQIIFDKDEIYLGEIFYQIENELAITSYDILDRRIGLSALEKLSEDYYVKVDEIIKAKKEKD